jgi:hypothetical protein
VSKKIEETGDIITRMVMYSLFAKLTATKKAPSFSIAVYDHYLADL